MIVLQWATFTVSSLSFSSLVFPVPSNPISCLLSLPVSSLLNPLLSLLVRGSLLCFGLWLMNLMLMTLLYNAVLSKTPNLCQKRYHHGSKNAQKTEIVNSLNINIYFDGRPPFSSFNIKKATCFQICAWQWWSFIHAYECFESKMKKKPNCFYLYYCLSWPGRPWKSISLSQCDFFWINKG